MYKTKHYTTRTPLDIECELDVQEGYVVIAALSRRAADIKNSCDKSYLVIGHIL